MHHSSHRPVPGRLELDARQTSLQDGRTGTKWHVGRFPFIEFIHCDQTSSNRKIQKLATKLKCLSGDQPCKNGVVIQHFGDFSASIIRVDVRQRQSPKQRITTPFLQAPEDFKAFARCESFKSFSFVIWSLYSGLQGNRNRLSLHPIFVLGSSESTHNGLRDKTYNINFVVGKKNFKLAWPLRKQKHVNTSQ